jgi:hypothetical protein
MNLNYAPLWLRAYNSCVDAQPKAGAFTKAGRHYSACMNLASRLVAEQMKLDEASRGPRER